MTNNTSLRVLPNRRHLPGNDAAVVAPAGIAQCHTACSGCNLRELCRPCCGMTRAEKEIAARLAFVRSRIRRGDALYRYGDRFSYLYAVRNGFFKSIAMLENGREQVTGFSMAGEVLGLDGVAPERHACNAVALEDSEVCAIPFAGLQELAQEIPALQRHFYKTMSREIEREHGMMLQLGSMNAEERLAMFLLDLSRRFAARGYSRSEFHLRMTREEIGSYLGLKFETVSRTFSKFQEEGLIGVQQKFVSIQDSAGLQQVLCRNAN